MTSGAAGRLERIEDDADRGRCRAYGCLPSRAISSSPGPGTSRPGVLAGHATSGALIRCGKKAASLLPVHERVDDLCATTPNLCRPGGNAVDSATWPHPLQGVYLGKRQPDPVYAEEIAIVHTPRRKR